MAEKKIISRTVNVYIQSGEAQKALDKLIEKEKSLNEQLTKTSDPKKIQGLKTELIRLSVLRLLQFSRLHRPFFY